MSQRWYWTTIFDKKFTHIDDIDRNFLCVKIILKQIYIRTIHWHYFIVIVVRLPERYYNVFFTYILFFIAYTTRRENKDELFWNRSVNVTCTKWIQQKSRQNYIMRDFKITRIFVLLLFTWRRRNVLVFLIIESKISVISSKSLFKKHEVYYFGNSKSQYKWALMPILLAQCFI